MGGTADIDAIHREGMTEVIEQEEQEAVYSSIICIIRLQGISFQSPPYILPCKAFNVAAAESSNATQTNTELA